MAISIISSDNQNNAYNKGNDSNFAKDLPFKNYPNYIQIGHFVLGEDGKDGGTPLVVKNLIKHFIKENKSGYLDWTTSSNKFYKNSYIKRYYDLSEKTSSDRKGPFVLLDGFMDQPLNFSTGMTWDNGTVESLVKSNISSFGNKVSEIGNLTAALSRSKMATILGSTAAVAGQTASGIGTSSGTAKDITSLYTSGTTGFLTTKIPTGGNHLMLNINLRKYDLIGDGSPMDMANLLTIFTSPLESLSALALNAVLESADTVAQQTQVTKQLYTDNVTGTTGQSNNNSSSILDQVTDPTFIWNRYAVSLITNYRRIGASTSKSDPSGNINDEDRIILLPMIITQFNYTPSDNMIVLKNGSIGPAYVEYQLSLSSLMIMSNDDLDNILATNEIVTSADDLKKNQPQNNKSNETPK